MGTLIDRVHRELTDADHTKIVNTYHAWRGDVVAGIADPESATNDRAHKDLPGFCKSATTKEIAAPGYVLTPGRYVGAEEAEDDGDPFGEMTPLLIAELEAQSEKSDKLESAIRQNLAQFGFKP